MNTGLPGPCAILSSFLNQVSPPTSIQGGIRLRSATVRYSSPIPAEQGGDLQHDPAPGTAGYRWDNGCIESWRSRLKKALAYVSHFRTRLAIFEYIEAFSTQHWLHSAPDCRTPKEAAARSA